MTPIRGNVVALPGTLGEDELAKRLIDSVDVQRRYFLRYGLVVVPTRGKVMSLPRILQASVEAWARVRLGLPI
jgi:hypothetical protein